MIEENFKIKKIIRKLPNSNIYLCEHLLTGVDLLIEIYQNITNKLNDEITNEIGLRKILCNISTLHRTLHIIKKPTYLWFLCENISSQNPLELINNEILPIEQTKYFFFLLTYTILELQGRGYGIIDWEPYNFCFFTTMIKYTNYKGILKLNNYKNDFKLFWINDIRWMSPEMLKEGEYDLISSSIYCLGLYLYLFLTGKQFINIKENKNLYRKIFQFDKEEFNIKDKNALNLLKQLLSINPKDRPTIREILAHPFLKPLKPFPHLNLPNKLDEKIKKFLIKLNYDPDSCFFEAKSLEINEKSLIYYLVSLSISKGFKFYLNNNFNNNFSNFILFPNNLNLNYNNFLFENNNLNLKDKNLNSNVKNLLNLSKIQLKERNNNKIISLFN